MFGWDTAWELFVKHSEQFGGRQSISGEEINKPIFGFHLYCCQHCKNRGDFPDSIPVPTRMLRNNKWNFPSSNSSVSSLKCHNRIRFSDIKPSIVLLTHTRRWSYRFPAPNNWPKVTDSDQFPSTSFWLLLRAITLYSASRIDIWSNSPATVPCLLTTFHYHTWFLLSVASISVFVWFLPSSWLLISSIPYIGHLLFVPFLPFLVFANFSSLCSATLSSSCFSLLTIFVPEQSQRIATPFQIRKRLQIPD